MINKKLIINTLQFRGDVKNRQIIYEISAAK